MPESTGQTLDFSLVTASPLHRLERRLGLGLAEQGLLRPFVRGLSVALVCWLPYAVGTVLQGNLRIWRADWWVARLDTQVRCLVSIPIFLVAEAWIEAAVRSALRYAEKTGVIDDALLPSCRELVRKVERARDSWLVLLVIAVLVVFASTQYDSYHEQLLRRAASAHALSALPSGFADHWADWVVRPLNQWLLAHWLWRLGLVTWLFRRLAKLNLRLVPTHPDGAAGLGFVDFVPLAFTPVVFAISALVAASWGMEVALGQTHVRALWLPMAMVVVLLVLLFLAPCGVFVGRLMRVRQRALLDYGVLVGAHGRMVRRRWVKHEAVQDSPMLDAPELGSVCDVNAMYESIEAMRPLPLRRTAFICVFVAAALPMLGVMLIEVPLSELLLPIVKALF